MNLTVLRDRALLVLPFLAALAALPYIIPGGTAVPWAPWTVDLQVYRDAAQTVLNGGDIIALRSGYHHLAFIYPPIAAVLAIPMTWVSYTALQVIWTGISVACLLAVLRRFGVPGDWRLALAGLACVLLAEPVWKTLGYGQVNLVLLALVALDVLPRADGRRWLLGGVGTGIAAAIKLTPALFVVYLFLIGRRRDGLVAVATFTFLSVLGYVVEPRATKAFWRGLLIDHDTRTPTGPITMSNQAVSGFFARVVGESGTIGLIALAVSALVALSGLVAGLYWHRAGEERIAVGVIGVASVLASPLAWSHHFVWAVPLALAIWLHGWRTVPRGTLVVGSFWLVWVLAGRYMLLPDGNFQERSFVWWQDAIAAVTPVLGVTLLVVTLLDARAAAARSGAGLRGNPRVTHRRLTG